MERYADCISNDVVVSSQLGGVCDKTQDCFSARTNGTFASASRHGGDRGRADVVLTLK